MIKLLLITHFQLSQTYHSYLSAIPDIEIVAKTESDVAAVELAQRYNPNIVIMDISLPQMDCLTLTHKMLRRNPRIKVITLTSLDSQPLSARFICAGSQGYLSKKAPAEEVIAAIRHVYAGQVYISIDVSKFIAIRQVTQGANSPFCDLSHRELQVMTMIAQGMRVADIANKLCLSSKTINTYRYRLFEKLNIKNNVNLTHLAVKYGILEN